MYFLLSEIRRVQSAIRIGDLYALMVEGLYQNGAHEQAYDALRKMQTHVTSMNIDYYLDRRIVAGLYKALGLDTKIVETKKVPAAAVGVEDDDQVEEEIYEG
jgi:hypothetical protein